MSRDEDDRNELSDWERSIDNILLALWKIAKPLLCPPLLLYGGVEDTWDQCVKRAWWLYATYFVLTIPLFWNQLMAGEYIVLASVVEFHLVVGTGLIATVVPTMLAGVPFEWPAMLAAPGVLP